MKKKILLIWTIHKIGGMTIEMMTERSGMISPTSSVRRRRKCILIGSIIAGLAAVVIIATTIKTRQHIKAAIAEALVKREPDSITLNTSPDPRRKINFDDFLHYTFYAETYNGTWISDDEVLYLDKVCFITTFFPVCNISFRLEVCLCIT